MAAYRTMWRGAISCGLIVIPVGMTKATTEGESVAFNQLCPDHPDSGVQYKKVCAVHQHELTGKPKRGFAVGKGQWVEIEDDDLENVPVPTAHVIKIEEFVDAEAIGVLYPEGSYFLSPEDVGVPAYNILAAALAETGKVGIGKYALRDREHFCCLESYEGVLLLTALHYPSELRDPALLGVTVTDVKPAELAMGIKLLESMTAEWEPSKYHDEFSAGIRAVVDAKLNNTPVPAAPPAPKAATADLLSVLAASVKQAEEAKKATKKPATRAKKDRAA